MEINESEIIRQCLAGNWQNYDQLHEIYLPKIYRYVYYRVRHKQTAEDLTATVFLKMIQHLHSFKPGTMFAAWIYSIARNTIIDHSRVTKPTVDLEQAAELRSKDDISSEVDTKLKLESIRNLLSELTPLQREVVTLRVWDELTHKEISEMLKISESNSKISFSRAMGVLKEKVSLAVFLALIINSSV